MRDRLQTTAAALGFGRMRLSFGGFAGAASVVLRRLGVDLPHEVVEDLGHVDLVLGGGLHERAVEVLGELLALVFRHHSLVVQVTFVADQDHWHVGCVFDAHDLVVELHEVVERRLGCYRVDQDEALAALHVQVSHCCELFLYFNYHVINLMFLNYYSFSLYVYMM